MPKYLIQASYNADGAKGLLRDGGSKRRAMVEQALGGVGGRVEAFYYAFGDADAVIIVDVPDHTTAAAVSMSVNASGVVSLKTTPLLTVEEMDAASKKGITYRAPGQ